MHNLHYINKDVTSVTTGVIAHGCNCQGAMGSGVAGAIRKKWPVVFEKYKIAVDTNKANGNDSSRLLGKVVFVQVEEETIVANCFTQVYYGRGEVHAVPSAIEQALASVLHFAHMIDMDIYIPKIGAGLGGLDWEEDVEPIVKKLAFENNEIDIYVCSYGD